ncbi:MAG: hypothetical protein N2560_10135 [Ignavibacteria bacterium]|nr:hypothetical protein [Ignavibacteria bacterium]
MWIEIFRTGTFTDSKGRVQSFTESDLEKIARQYNEKVEKEPSEEAPLVKGHPESGTPAHGWVERLARRGKILYAKLKSLTKEIIQEIEEGRYRKVSVSLYPNLMLRHIGLLGGETPAVKGLRPISFVEFDDIANFEYETSSNDFIELRQEIRRLEIENSKLARQNEALRNDLDKAYHESLARNFRDFLHEVNSSTDFIIIPPNKEESVVELLQLCAKLDNYLRESNCSIVSEDFSLVDRVKQFISELKPLPLRKEFTVANKENWVFEQTFDGKKVDEERLNIHIRAKELQKIHPELSYEQALLLINKQ